ncbi:group II intron maturase-specific domain-containing protein [Paenibacillus elgii]|uniref:group II intron maturase-specific domain-containing protein n=1 Tax=Paenibacillus elgii TaxID=189691 RepID=UPI001CB8FF1F
MRQTIRSWRIQLKSEKTLEDLSKMFNPVLRGWDNYYGRYYKAEMHSVYRRMNRALMNWAMRKYKRFRQRRKRALDWLNQCPVIDRGPSLSETKKCTKGINNLLQCIIKSGKITKR